MYCFSSKQVIFLAASHLLLNWQEVDPNHSLKTSGGDSDEVVVQVS